MIMQQFFFIGVLLIASGVWADDQASTTATTVDVNAILSNAKNPFQSQLPSPPAPAIVDQLKQNPTPNDNSGNNASSAAAPVPPPEPQKPKVSIEGIVWSDTIHQAIINGQVVGVGDEINGIQIKQIQRSGITVTYKNKDFFYTIE